MNKSRLPDFEPVDPTLAKGISPSSLKKLDTRLTEWLNWRHHGAPCPEWHPASRKTPDSSETTNPTPPPS